METPLAHNQLRAVVLAYAVQHQFLLVVTASFMVSLRLPTGNAFVACQQQTVLCVYVTHHELRCLILMNNYSMTRGMVAWQDCAAALMMWHQCTMKTFAALAHLLAACKWLLYMFCQGF